MKIMKVIREQKRASLNITHGLGYKGRNIRRSYEEESHIATKQRNMIEYVSEK
jgi:hypothetical protein